MSRFFANEIVQFKIIIEQLEVCCSFINEKSIAKYRIALILLDNISEILLHRLCQQAFKRDEFIKWITPQQYSVSRRNKINRFFDEKIKVIAKERKISKQITEIISIGHKYRNAIYHRDEYNSAIIGSITKVLFITVCDLFAETQCGIETSVIGGYKKSFEWLVPYGIEQTYIDFPRASKIISESLKRKMRLDRRSLNVVFREDIEKRIKNIQQVISKELPWKTPVNINHILKWFEFQETYPYLEDELSSEYRKYIYKIAKEEPVNIEPAQLKQIEEGFWKEYHKRVQNYRQKISYSTIDRVEKNINKLGSMKNTGELLSRYFILDENLSKLENYIKMAATEWDRIVQREIDLKRGK